MGNNYHVRVPVSPTPGTKITGPGPGVDEALCAKNMFGSHFLQHLVHTTTSGSRCLLRLVLQ